MRKALLSNSGYVRPVLLLQAFVFFVMMFLTFWFDSVMQKNIFTDSDGFKILLSFYENNSLIKPN